MSRVAPPAGSIRSAKSPRRTGSTGGPSSTKRTGSCRFSRLRFLVRLSICCRRALILVRVERLNFLRGVSAAAVFAFQLSYLSVKTQRPRTRRALVNCDLLCHVHPPFRCRLLIRSAPLSYIKEGRTATCCTPAVNINSLNHRGRFRAWEFRTRRRICPCCLHGRT